MGKKKDGLIEILAQYFWNYKSYELEGVMKSYGISPDETLNPNPDKPEKIFCIFSKFQVQ